MTFPALFSSPRRSYFTSLSATALTMGLLIGFPFGCSSTPQVIGGPEEQCKNDEQCADGQVCSNQKCIVECDSCGVTCTTTEQCPVGQFCAENDSCQQECTPGNDDTCSGARACSENGKCIAKDDIEVPELPMGGGSGGDGDDEVCIDVEVDFTPQIPNVVLLIDQSASMTDDDTAFRSKVEAAVLAGEYVPWDCPDSDNRRGADETWRWNVVRNVLLHPETGIVKPLEEKVRFGMATYSSDNGFGNDPEAPRVCPMLSEVDIAFGTHQAMLDAFQCSDVINDTPTRESLTAIAEKLAAADLEGPKIIVLATDGEPDTCDCDDWEMRNGAACVAESEYMGEIYPAGQYEQILVALEAQRIHDELGITIEVINVGDDSLTAHLDSVAASGGALSGMSIDGTSPGALIDAFETIIDGVRSCVIELDGKIATGEEDSGTVTLNGEELELDGPDGWVVNSPSEIELVGAACDAIKSGDHDIDVKFPCESFEIITR